MLANEPRARCIGQDPLLFDIEEAYPLAFDLCDACPVQLWCLETVNPAASWYDGVVGGLVWKDGALRPRKDHIPTAAQKDYINRFPDIEKQTSARYSKPAPIDPVLVAQLVAGTIPWQSVTPAERQEAAVLMRIQGMGFQAIMERTRLSALRLKRILDAAQAQLEGIHV